MKMSMDWAGYREKVAGDPDLYYEKIIDWCSEILADAQLIEPVREGGL